MFSLKLYRFLLNFYPATFRENYAGPLERDFTDEYGEAPTRLAVLGLWVRTLADFCVSMPRLLVREFKEDTRHALRLWRKRPLPVVMAILALAIGIGANIGVFGVIDALMLRSLPFREPEKLVQFWGYVPVKSESALEFAKWGQQSQYFEDAATFICAEVNLGGDRNASRVQLTEATANLFDLMGVAPRMGRGFSAGEDSPGRDRVAVIGYGLWQQMFGGELRAIGSKIYLNGTPLEVVGIAPAGFDYPEKSEVWTPTAFDTNPIPKTSVFYRRFIGRLKQGLSLAQGRAAFEAEIRRVEPEKLSAPSADRTRFVGLRDELVGPLKHPSLILSAAVGLLLLVACANVANLLLSRTADRIHELAIRSALGASRARLIQQLLTESLVMAAAGAAASVVFANWVVKMAAAFQPTGLSALDYTLSNWRVAAFAAGLALTTAVVFGIAPAMFVGSSLIRSNAPRHLTTRLRSFVVAVQIGLTVILLGGGAALGCAFLNLMRVDNGYVTTNVVSLRVALAGGNYERHTETTTQYSHEALRRIRAVEGVLSAGASEFLPLGTSAYMSSHFKVDQSGSDFAAGYFPVTSEFFKTMGSVMLAGRDLAEVSGKPGTEMDMVVSESVARQISADPRSSLGRYLSAGKVWSGRIVGVVRDLRFDGPTGTGSQMQIFPVTSEATQFVIRVKDKPLERMAAIRHAVQSVDPQIPVYDAMTMDQRLAEITARPRFYALATGMFGGCALLLSIVGLNGVTSYAVTQRTREMGIRMALGTTPGALRFMMLRNGLVLVGIGAIPGVIATLFAAQWLEPLVSGATSLAGAASFTCLAPIAGVAALSVWIATNRISKMDPSVALRVE